MNSISYIAPSGTSGYAEAAKNYILALGRHFKIQWQPLYYDDSLANSTIKDLFAEQFINPIPDPDVLIIHNTADKWEELKKKYDQPSIKKRIGITVWETDKLHPDWVNHCNHNWLDEIWVPVKWNKEVFEQSGVTKPIKVVPHIFYEPELEIKNTNLASFNHLLPDNLINHFLFYTIGQWNERKGINETIHSFCKAFSNQDKVVLLVKTFWAKYTPEHQQKCHEQLNSILVQYPNAPKIFLLTKHFSRTELLTLHAICNAYISLCKSEGWGLGAFDAAATGNPVIITGYGGQLEYLPKNYPYLVNFSLQQVQGMNHIPWYLHEQQWANANIDDAAEKLRIVFNNKNFKKDVSLLQHIHSNFSMQSIDWVKLIS